MTRLVEVEVLRRYPRHGRIYRPGTVLSVPEYALASATAGARPFVRVVGTQGIILDADFDATEGALDLARAVGLDLKEYSGRGSGEGGRIHKPDVESWAKARGLIPTED